MKNAHPWLGACWTRDITVVFMLLSFGTSQVKEHSIWGFQSIWPRPHGQKGRQSFDNKDVLSLGKANLLWSMPSICILQKLSSFSLFSQTSSLLAKRLPQTLIRRSCWQMSRWAFFNDPTPTLEMVIFLMAIFLFGRVCVVNKKYVAVAVIFGMW